MEHRETAVLLTVLLVGCCAYCVYLGVGCSARSRRLAQLREEVNYLSELSTQNETLRKRRAEFEELEQLKQNHVELGELALRIRALQQSKARQQGEMQANTEQIRKLESENDQLRADLEKSKAAPANREARRSLDFTQLSQIGSFFRGYAQNHGGRYPQDFSELRYYLAANVYPGIETNRFEIVNEETVTEPSQQVVVRTRYADDQNNRFLLFADGHVETRGSP